MKEFHMGPGPYIKSNNKTDKMMRHLLIALLPIIIFSFIKNGVIPYVKGYTNLFELFYPLIFILIPAFTTILIEFLYIKFILKKHGGELTKHLKASYAIFPGLFLSLVLPLNTPFIILIFGALVATIIGKMLFGGFGNNIFNPALIGALFIWATYSVAIVSNGGYLNSYESDTLSSATPLSVMTTGVGTYEELVEPFGNLWDFLIGFIPGSVGETSAILCILGFLYLAFFKVIKWKIPVIYIATVFIVTYIIGGLNNQGIWYPLFQILSGGLMFGAVFMATDPVTSPTTPVGQVLYGVFLGLLTIIFRYLTPYPEGVLTAILTMNMFVFIIDRIGCKARFNFNKAVPYFIFAWALIIIVGFGIANSFKKEVVDSNFNIIEKTAENNVTNYIVTQKGFSGLLKAKISFEGEYITNIQILEQNESYYSRIESANYINKIIEEQHSLSSLDTVSGVTITSSALKTMIINTMEDYNR